MTLPSKFGISKQALTSVPDAMFTALAAVIPSLQLAALLISPLAG